MATHKSAEKRAKQNEQRRVRNVSARSKIKTMVKTVHSAVQRKDTREAQTLLTLAIPAIAKAAARGAFHKRTASRRISRLTKSVNSLSGH